MHPANTRRFLAASGAALIILASKSTSATGSGSNPPPPSTPIPTQVEMLEWDLPTQMDSRPGAVMVDLTGDGNRLWFVTRVQEPIAPRVYRMDLKQYGKKVNTAQWLSWELDPLESGIANGVRKIKTSGDKRYVFIHTSVSLQRIDTGNCTTTSLPVSVTCPRTTWVHEATSTSDANGPVNPIHGSDVAIDEYNNNVYAAMAVNDASTFDPAPDKSFIQRLNPHASSSNVTRWYVGGSAGLCPTSLDSAPCLSGITTDRRNRDLVYYAEPAGGPDGAGAIAELDTRRNYIRRWSFAELAHKTGDPTIREPRQLHFDNDGTLWTITGSKHLVSLDPRKNRMSKHKMPGDNPFTDPFGVGPDGGLIGYTDASIFDPKVGMLMPERRYVLVGPYGCNVSYKTFTLPGNTAPANRTAGNTPPQPRVLPGQIVRNGDGTFSEAFTATEATMPLGITQDQTASQGTFFFAVGDVEHLTFNRIGRVRLPRGNQMHGRCERDDDDHDDDGKRAAVDDDADDDGIKNGYDLDNDNDGVPDFLDDDDDGDGIEDNFDTGDHKEYKQTSDQDLAPGERGEDLFTLVSGTLLVIASAVSADPLLPVKVEVVNAAGTVIASSLQTPGAAAVTFVPPPGGGDYTLRVTNAGSGPASIATKLLTRSLWPLGL